MPSAGKGAVSTSPTSHSRLLSLRAPSSSGSGCRTCRVSDPRGQGHGLLLRGSPGAYSLLVPAGIRQPAEPLQPTLQQSPPPSGLLLRHHCLILLFWELLPGKVKKFIIFPIWKCCHTFPSITWLGVSCGGGFFYILQQLVQYQQENRDWLACHIGWLKCQG